MTVASLKSYSQKDLAQMAKQGGVRGWHAMRKDQLVRALLTVARSKAIKTRSVPIRGVPSRTVQKAEPPSRRNGHSNAVVAPSRPKPAKPPIAKPTNPRVLKHLNQVRAKLNRSKNLAFTNVIHKQNGHAKDRVVVMVRDPFWLHVCWEITSRSVERVQAAMGQEWHSAQPVLRLLEVTDGGTTTPSERVAKDIEIHGGVSNWYVHVDDPPKSYRMELGYMGASRKLYSLARSNVVSTPLPGSSDVLDENWTSVAENFDKIYAMSGGYSPDGTSLELQELFEERLRRPMGSPMVTRYGSSNGLLFSNHDFKFEVDAELIIFGSTVPNAHVTLRGEPVRLRPDGSFTVRMNLPNQRQVIPAVACSASGSEQRTIVLAIERNTKAMEPVVRESNE